MKIFNSISFYAAEEYERHRTEEKLRLLNLLLFMFVTSKRSNKLRGQHKDHSYYLITKHNFVFYSQIKGLTLKSNKFSQRGYPG